MNTIKKIFLLSFFTLFLFTSTSLIAQVEICEGESVEINLGTYIGTIQWQKSKNLTSWTDMSGENSTQLNITPSKSYYYRASVVDGTCNPVYSDTTFVEVHSMPIVDAGLDTSICKGGIMTIGGSPTVKNGTPPYNYTWTPSADLNSGSVPNPTSFTDVTTTYKITIVDDAGCTGEDEMLLTVFIPPVVDAGDDVSVCSGVAATLGGSPTSSGGSPPYSYKWTPDTDLSNNKIANPVVEVEVISQTIKIYNLKVTDSKGCYNTDGVVLTIGPIPIANAGKDTGLCSGNVKIGGSPTASGGIPPYTYIWSPSLGLTNTSVSNPLASPNNTTNYFLKIIGSNGCVDYDTVNVRRAPSPIADAGIDKNICKNGSVIIGGSPSASSGTPPYIYSWSPYMRISNPNVANPSVYPNDELDYVLKVTDHYGCVSRDTVNISVGTADPNAGVDTFICYGESIVIGGNPVATRGVPPYTYSWTHASDLNNSNLANPTATPSLTTIYKVTITDSLGCISYDSLEVLVDPIPIADAGIDTITCTHLTIGGYPVATSGTAPYSYLWTPATALSDSSASNPEASPSSTTTYVVKVSDHYNCSITDTMVLTIASAPVADAGTDKGWCTNAVTIGGSPTASGGLSPYTYIWMPSTGLSNNLIANPTTNLKTQTTYVVRVKDDNACVDFDTMELSTGLVVDAGRDTAICSGTFAIGGSPSAYNGVTPYTYSWSPSTGLSSTSVANPVAGPSATTTYILTVTDGNGCINKDTIVLTIGNNVTGTQTFTYTGSSQSFTVPGVCITEITVTVNGAGGGGSSGGDGGKIVGTVACNSNQTFTVIVGGKGANATYNRCGQGGGGFSGLLLNGNHIITAGGGGGASSTNGTTNGTGGDGGYPGQSGTNGGCGSGGAGGSTGLSAAGGIGGVSGGQAGDAGTSSGGGDGGDGASNQASGGGGGGYGTAGGTGGTQYSVTGQAGNGGFGGGGGGGGGGWGSTNSRQGGAGGGGGGYRGGAGGTAPSGCSTSGGGGGGGGANHFDSTTVSSVTNTAGGGASSQNNGTVIISW
ncbi:MAG: hypothetical protein U9R42_14465 [Bacteroidota bacterium]|nr:hypothetical protein [Bacteroidota bacterium]